MTFAIGSLPGIVLFIVKPERIAFLKQPPKVWITGIGGLFGYHFLYFTALRNAPAVEAGLIAYLWPLFIVVGSALLPGERLRWYHVAGACAFIWSAYSLLSRRFQAVPTSVVTWFCAATSALSLCCHFAIEETVLPATSGQWLAVLGLGLMPVGAAFYAWDHGVKRGNIQVLGAASYAAPLLSTLVLMATGFAEPSLVILVACLLITFGAVVAAKDLIFPRRAEAASEAGA
jgi:drug/metabolite transporter (DMT)-like permease